MTTPPRFVDLEGAVIHNSFPVILAQRQPDKMVGAKKIEGTIQEVTLMAYLVFNNPRERRFPTTYEGEVREEDMQLHVSRTLLVRDGITISLDDMVKMEALQGEELYEIISCLDMGFWTGVAVYKLAKWIKYDE